MERDLLTCSLLLIKLKDTAFGGPISYQLPLARDLSDFISWKNTGS